MNRVEKLAVYLVATLIASAMAGAAEKSAMTIESPAFHDGAEIARKYTCDDADVSPPLAWRGAPSRTQAFALIADDPDAPGGTWVHWVIYDLPANTKELSEAMPTNETLSNAAKQGVNDFRKIGYGGPCPPSGAAHRYVFTLYALDAPTSLSARLTKQQLLAAIKGRVLAKAEIVGKYGR
jgi:Raf kinase inhibitor-like YbhB/YbcL family protein